jgi:hypothetical protein
MRISGLPLPRLILLHSCLFLIPIAAWPQAPPQSRIVERVNEGALVTLRGNTHPLAQPQFDQGAAPPDLPMARMLLVLKRSDAQESALQTLLDDQQDRNSPSYHQWLTPDAFGRQFGPSDQDIQAVASWLILHGFQIGLISRGRTVIEFSGTAAQVQQAFHTEIHKYTVNREDRWANASDPQIPAALAPVVEGVATLHNFSKKPLIEIAEERIAAHIGPGQTPQVTFQNGRHALGPWDYDNIYNILPIINPPSGVSGPPAGFGTIVAVIGRSNIDIQDVARFRAIFNLQDNNPQIFVNGPDPGNLGGEEEAEAVLDTTWSGAIAPGAGVWLIVSASTNTTDGVDLSEVYIIDGGVSAAVMTESFGTCEAGATAAEATNISQLAEQAAAEGITYIVSAGDTGSAGCDNRTETQATGPFSVNVLASSPFTVAVGGTQFNENGNDALYWNTSNDQSLKSARSYIPEDVWNQSCVGSQCGQQKPNIIAGGGGSSILFGKPSWQSGVKGIPNDGMRDVPDIALTAASHDPYLICLRGSCQPDAQGNFFFAGASGTSAAAPSFAGIAALMSSLLVPLNSHPRLGQINYVLYRLAANQNWSSCNGSNTSGLPATSCIFNDVTEGNNSVPGEADYGTGTAKYQSGIGYDLTSGLGSVNVANLANHWSDVTVSPTTTTLSLSPISFTHGTLVSVNVGVTSASGTPAGDVSLFRSGVSPAIPSLPIPGNFFTLNSTGSVSASTKLMPGGYYSISAHYAGDGSFMASDSGPVALNVSPEPSSIVAEALTLGQNGKFVSFTGGPYGSFVYVRADVAGQSGIGFPTGSVNFTDNGVNVPGSPYALNSEGNTATLLALFAFAVGQHSVMADYSGDPSFSASTSSTIGFNITQASTSTAVTSSGAVQGPELTATVSTNSGGEPPSGTVTFFIGGMQVGSPVPVSGMSAVANSLRGVQQGAQATASFTDSQLPNGQYSLSATYSGDKNYGGSSAPPTMINVQADYSLGASANSITIANPGGTGSLTLTITGIDGFNGTVSFSCSGLPSMSSCQFNPASVTGSGSSVMSIITKAPTALIMLGGPSNAMNRWVSGSGVTVAGIFLLSGLTWRRRRMTRVFAVFALLASAVGCAGSGSGPVQPPPDPGTLPGSYTVTVTGTSGALTHSTGLVLNVQ